MGNLTKTDKTRIELWTARDMQFVITPGVGPDGIGTIPKYTSCAKPVYTGRIKDHVEWVEKGKGNFNRPPGVKCVCVKLEGVLRYVWRTDVLTKEEYDVARAKERDSLRALRSKPRGTVDKSGQDANGDKPDVAASIPDGERQSSDD